MGFLPILISASWDGSVVRWSYKGSESDGAVKMDQLKKMKGSVDDDDDKECYPKIEMESESDGDSDSVSDDGDDVFTLPEPVSLDMPEHLRKHRNYDYW